MDETLLRSTATACLYEALDSPFGIVVQVQMPERGLVSPALRARQVLYRFAKENADFRGIQIRLSPDDPINELWLLKDARPITYKEPPTRDEDLSSS